MSTRIQVIASSPLAGITVVDFGRLLAAPFAGMILADLGATVIKVEEPPRGDLTRWMMRPLTSNGETAAYFASINRGKRSIAIDLKREEGQTLVRELAARSDVFLDNYRPEVRPRLGLDDGVLRSINPQLVICSISAFGQDGPLASHIGVDLNVQALSGVMHLTGADEPMRLGVPAADLAGGLYAVIAILAQLVGRGTAGPGSLLDISLLDSLTSMLTYMAANYSVDGRDPAPVGTAHHSVVPYQAFATADSHIVIPCLSENFWAPLCRGLDKPEWIEDARYATNVDRLSNRDELLGAMDELLSQRTTAQWLEIFEAQGFPAAPIATVADVMANPQLQHRGMIQSVADSSGSGAIRTTGSPVQLHATDAVYPLYGEHTREILRDVLGKSDAEVAELVASNIVFQKDNAFANENGAK